MWTGWTPIFAVCAFAAWGYAGFALLWLALWAATGEVLLPVRLALYFAAWIAFGLIAVSVFALAQRRWRLAALAVPLAVLLALPYAPQFAPRFNGSQIGEGAFTVMSYSVMGRNRNADAMASVILKERPDILFLQELHVASDLLERINGLYGGAPVYAESQARTGLTVISRFPLTSLPPLRGIQKMVAHLPCGDIHLWNLRAPKTFDGVARQQRFVAMLAEDMRMHKGPALAAGDFNTTERSASYAYLRGFVRNAHEEAGFGLGASFPAPGRKLGRFLPAMIRIDHVFFSGDLVAVDAVVARWAGGSDHYPVKAKFIRASEKCGL